MAPGGPFLWNISVLFCTLSLGFDWTAEDEQRPTRPHVFQRTPAIHPEHTPAPHARSAPLIPEVMQTWEKWRPNVDLGSGVWAHWTGVHVPGPRGELASQTPGRCRAPTPTLLLLLPYPPPAPTLSKAGFLWTIFGADVAGLRSHIRGQGWTSPVRLPQLLGFWTSE